MERITQKHLEAIVRRINVATHSPLEPYTKGPDGRHVANIGNYYLDHAYGGVSLHRMVNPDGGVSNVLGIAHVSKRDLADQMHAFLAGIDAGSQS